MMTLRFSNFVSFHTDLDEIPKFQDMLTLFLRHCSDACAKFPRIFSSQFVSEVNFDRYGSAVAKYFLHVWGITWSKIVVPRCIYSAARNDSGQMQPALN